MLDIGRVCLKTAGRESGKLCTIVKKVDDKFVEVTGPKNLTNVKRRRCNIEHLEPTEFKLKIKTDATDAIVLTGYKKEGVLEKFGLEEKDIKVSIEKPNKKEVKKKAKPVKKAPKKKK